MSKTHNKLTDLNNLLFEQLEKLSDDEMKKEDIKIEIEKSKAIANIASQIIANGSLALKAEEMRLEYNFKETAKLPDFLGGLNE